MIFSFYGENINPQNEKLLFLKRQNVKLHNVGFMNYI